MPVSTPSRRLVIDDDFCGTAQEFLTNTYYIVNRERFEKPEFILNAPRHDHGKRGKKGKQNKDWDR
jgi:hypothetical protein